MEIIENEKKLQKNKKFSKRVFTNRVLCGKLWEKITVRTIATYIVERSKREFLRSLVKAGGLIKKKGSRSKSGKNRYY